MRVHWICKVNTVPAPYKSNAGGDKSDQEGVFFPFFLGGGGGGGGGGGFFLFF